MSIYDPFFKKKFKNKAQDIFYVNIMRITQGGKLEVETKFLRGLWI